MDPFLELSSNWGDFAPKFLGEISIQLLDKLLPEYDVRMEEYVLVMREEERLHRVRPDMMVKTSPQWQPDKWEDGSTIATATATPTAVIEAVSTEVAYPDLEPEGQRHLKIIHAPDDRVVAVMELLSPTNKAPGDEAFDAYLRKRNELIDARVHFIELDLLRGGKRLPMKGELPPADYYAYIGRAERRPHCEVIGWFVQAKMPTIPIPLLPEDGEAELDLTAAFRTAYERSYFDRRVRYTAALQPPPDAALKRWIDDCLAKRNR